MNDDSQHQVSEPPEGDGVVYLALVLDDSSREALLARFPPIFEIVRADHLTLAFPATDDLWRWLKSDSMQTSNYA